MYYFLFLFLQRLAELRFEMKNPDDLMGLCEKIAIQNKKHPHSWNKPKIYAIGKDKTFFGQSDGNDDGNHS